MAVTQATYTGDGGATKSFSFPSIQQSDIKVTVDDVLKSSGTHYNITSYTTTGGGNVVFTSGNIPTSPQAIKIFRDTSVDVAKATYTAGSSVKAEDLNANNEQLLFKVQEDNQLIVTSEIQNAAVETAKIADNAITAAKIANGNVNADKLASNSVTTVKIQDDAVTAAKLANSINTEIAANTAKLTNATHTGDVTGSGALTIANDAVTTAKIANDAVTTDKLANSIVSDITANNAKVTNATHTGEVTGSGALTIANNAVVEAKIANNAVTSNKIASNAVTTDKIADSELSTLAGMQSTTASNLASATALTATTAELNQLDGITLETSLTTGSDTRIPTSKAVNDQILAVTNALGGFVAIANETSFPTANPDPSNGAGTVVSISQVSSGSAITINNSGVATISNGAGTGNTVTITGFPTTLRNTSLAASSGLQVQTTTTLHTYTFHKQLASAADIAAISATVNSFSNRYRVSSSAPTSSLDGGDLWYDTTNSKLMVYSSANSAWEEATAIGNFFISTISSSSSTGGGSATPNGTAYRFTISDAPTSAAQLIVSVDGVIQKPNAGSSQPSEGFVLVGNDIILGSAPANGASLFVTVIGSTVGIGTPSNNTVTTAILQNGSVTTAKIVDANVTTAKITDNAVTTAKLEDMATSRILGRQASGSGNPQHLTPTEARTVLNVENGATADQTAAEIKTLLNSDKLTNSQIANSTITSGQLADDAVTTSKLVAGAVNDGKLASNSVVTAKIADTAVTLAKLEHGTSSNDGKFLRANNGADPTFETVNTDLVSDTSPQLGGNLQSNNKNINFADGETGGNNRLTFGNGNDLEIYHDGTGYVHTNIENTTGDFLIRNAGDLYCQSNGTFFVSDVGNNERCAKFIRNGAVELNYDNVKKFETISTGVAVTGDMHHYAGSYINGSSGHVKITHDSGKFSAGAGNDARMYHDGTNTYFDSITGNLYLYNHASAKNITFGTEGSSRWYIYNSGHLVPNGNNAFDIGTNSNRVRNVYTNDLHLSNKGSSNDVDGTWGDWTIQEGESDLFLKNNRSGKKYKFNLTEVS